MKINAPVTPVKFPQPNTLQVLALRKRRNGHSGANALVFKSPSPSGATFLFVGAGMNSYLAESDWDSFMNGSARDAYELIGLFPINDMEVTFNA